MNAKRLFLMAIVGMTSGCALTSGSDRQSLYNPPGIHPSAALQSDASVPGQVPIAQYYKALTDAQEKNATKEVISDFVDKGIGLTSAYCLRWFQRLDDVQRRVDLQEKNFNVLRQLGTAFLGIGKAIPNWVTGYGAVNTAYSGIAENFNEAILAGPTTTKIKSQVLEMLRQSEVQLRKEAGGSNFTFAQAYSRLELHADTCTYSTVRDLLDTTLATAVARRNPVTGKISVDNVIGITNLQPGSPQQIIDTKAITSKVSALIKDRTKLNEINQVLKVVGAPKSDFTTFADAANSLELLYREAELNESDLKKWNDALK
jgi:hypothetical protein